LLNLPSERWDFSNFYSDKPDEVDSFACKVLAAGAVGIYLDIIERAGLEPQKPGADATRDPERVAKIFNSLLRAISIDRSRPPADVDPFGLDEGLQQTKVDSNLRQAYRERTAELFSTFEEKYQGRNCDEILGFDPFRYEEYDEATQAKIEEGGWMERCVDCMRHIIQVVKPE
jgi:hypothetical protein